MMVVLMLKMFGVVDCFFCVLVVVILLVLELLGILELILIFGYFFLKFWMILL